MVVGVCGSAYEAWGWGGVWGEVWAGTAGPASCLLCVNKRLKGLGTEK